MKTTASLPLGGLSKSNNIGAALINTVVGCVRERLNKGQRLVSDRGQDRMGPEDKPPLGFVCRPAKLP